MSHNFAIACSHCGHLGPPKLSLTGISYCCAECLSWSYVEVKEPSVYEAAHLLGGRAAVRELARLQLWRKS